MSTQIPKIEQSRMSGYLKRDGVRLDVKIYRIAGPDHHWNMEVVAENGRPVIWDCQFATDRDAYYEFQRAVKEDGISALQTDKALFRQKGRIGQGS